MIQLQTNQVNTYKPAFGAINPDRLFKKCVENTAANLDGLSGAEEKILDMIKRINTLSASESCELRESPKHLFINLGRQIHQMDAVKENYTLEKIINGLNKLLRERGDKDALSDPNGAPNLIKSAMKLAGDTYDVAVKEKYQSYSNSWDKAFGAWMAKHGK